MAPEESRESNRACVLADLPGPAPATASGHEPLTAGSGRPAGALTWPLQGHRVRGLLFKAGKGSCAPEKETGDGKFGGNVVPLGEPPSPRPLCPLEARAFRKPDTCPASGRTI